MQYDSLSSFRTDGAGTLRKGPLAIVLLEDEIEVDSTLRHHLDCGFATVLAVGHPDIALAEDTAAKTIRIFHDMLADGAMTAVLNTVMGMAGNRWLYYCYNAEYLFFPFCEHRSVGEMTIFSMEERRDAVLTYVIDLYAGDLARHPDAVSLDDAHLDKTGYYALARKDAQDQFRERQLDFFGGLRWRFEEHVPPPRRRIDRIALLRNQPGLEFRPDHTLNVQEYNTYACPWHHSLTAAICSFRTAKALKSNPGSTYDIDTFKWHNSAPFEWHSRQLLDLGLMEPGQWF